MLHVNNFKLNNTGKILIKAVVPYVNIEFNSWKATILTLLANSSRIYLKHTNNIDAISYYFKVEQSLEFL